jgi:hypothetical protein
LIFLNFCVDKFLECDSHFLVGKSMTGFADKFAGEGSGILLVAILELKLLSTKVTLLGSCAWNQLGKETEATLLAEGFELLVVVYQNFIFILSPLKSCLI